MPSLSVRTLDEDLVGRLKRRAARHGRSAEAEVRAILQHALIGEPEPGFEDLAAEGIELAPMRALQEPATRLAIALDHPAFDCAYLALAEARGCDFITADLAFSRKSSRGGLNAKIVILSQ